MLDSRGRPLSPWRTPLDVWVSKCRPDLEGADHPNPVAALGSALEPALREIVCADLALDPAPCPLVLAHPTALWIGQSPDLLTRQGVQIEFKTANLSALGSLWGDGPGDVPEHYRAQVTWQDLTARAHGLERVQIAALFLDDAFRRELAAATAEGWATPGADHVAAWIAQGRAVLRHYAVPIDPEYQIRLRRWGWHFWSRHVLRHDPPPVCAPRELPLARALAAAPPRPATSEEVALLRRDLALREQAGAIEAERDTVRAALARHVAGAAGLAGDGVRLTASIQRRVAWAAVAEELQVLALAAGVPPAEIAAIRARHTAESATLTTRGSR